MDITFNDDAMAKLHALVDRALDTKLAPMMEAECVRNCPKDTGALASTVSHEIENHGLHITATGDPARTGGDNRKWYATWVDLGHEIVAWGHHTGKIQPPTAWMRRALYRHYPGF